MSEVSGDFCFSQAMAQAERCLRCQDPVCIDGCPVRLPVTDFVRAIAEGDLSRAVALLRGANPLAAVCGRVCPHESQCGMKCHMTRQFGPVALADLERHVTDWEMAQPVIDEAGHPWRGEKIAIIGSGPSGLVCAGELARLGYGVTVYEALQAPGGVLRYGIPGKGLPESILDWEIASLERLGVRFVNDVVIGETIELHELIDEAGYAAAFIGTGAGLPRFMGIPGESLNGVYLANEFLTRINLMQAFDFLNSESALKVGRRVAVIGAGSAAMDAVRAALQLGAEKAMVISRSSEKEMTSSTDLPSATWEEGIEFLWLTRPVEVIGEDGWVTGLKCERMQPVEPDEAGRDSSVPVESSRFVLPADNVVLSIGSRPNPLLSKAAPRLKTHSKGGLLVGEQRAGSRLCRVYAAGDAVTGAATVILAAGAGKKAAQAIHSDLVADAA